jgi:hydroxymethylbilane synthase
LALWQAHWVKDRLEQLEHRCELVLIDTQGDKDQQPFIQMQGQGFFTKAVQDAVLEHRADIAVHSHKDLPSAPVVGLEVAAVTERADPRDVLLVRPGAVAGQKLEDRSQKSVDDQSSMPPHSSSLPVPLSAFHASLPLKTSATVGTSAVRRQKQLLYLRPDLKVKELRGNVPTRVQKLRDGHYDAVVLAVAGLERLKLDLSDLALFYLEPKLLVPAPAQGVLAIECRREDWELASSLTEINHMETYRAIAAERGLMAMLQGGCQLALGAYAVFEHGLVKLSAWYEGHYVEVEHRSSEGAAMLAFEALGRPSLRQP